MTKPAKPLTLLYDYFRLPGQSVKDFTEEVAQLSAIEKLELAEGVADERGIPAHDRDFAKLTAEAANLSEAAAA